MAMKPNLQDIEAAYNQQYATKQTLPAQSDVLNAYNQQYGNKPGLLGDIEAGASGALKSLQDIFRPSGETPLGLVGPQTKQAITKSAQQFVQPITGIDTNKLIGLSPSSGQKTIETATEYGLPLVGGAVGLGKALFSSGAPAELGEEATMPAGIIDKKAAKLQNNYINQNFLKRKMISDSNYQNALSSYGDAIPSKFQGEPGVENFRTVKNINFGGNPLDPQELLKMDPNQQDFLIQEGYIKPTVGNNPLQNNMDEDDYNLLHEFVKKSLKKAEANPTIKNLHQLAQDAGSASGSADRWQDRTGLSALEKSIKSNFIVPALNEFDIANNTSTAVPYINADHYFKTEIAPFRATKKLNSISLGLHNIENNITNPASISDALKEINTGRTTPSKFNFDPVTGLPKANIPQDHFLAQYQPVLESMQARQQKLARLKKISQFLAKHKLGAIGAGAIGAYEALKNNNK